MCKKLDLTGQRFGRWTVIKENGRAKDKKILWHCVCDCGSEKDVPGSCLVNGDSKSCGCYNIEKIIERSTKHGKTNTKLYNVWKSMKQRCNDKNCNAYLYYGGRGIKVCDEWNESFEAFYEWSIKNGYKEGLSIDRIDVNGNYCPKNCKWSTWEEQANNKRGNRVVSYNGENYTIAELSRISGIKYRTIIDRLNRGWTVENALFNGRIKDITYNGETHSVKYWSDKTGIEHSNLCKRIRSGWPIEDALNTPTRKHNTYKSTKKTLEIKTEE